MITSFDSFNKIIKSSKIKQKKESYLFIEQSYFDNDRAQLFIIIQPIHTTITKFSGRLDTVSQLESKGLSDENIMPLYATNRNLSLKLVWYNSRIKLKYKGSCLKQNKGTFSPENVVTLFIVYELNTWLGDLSFDFAFKNCLFISVKLTKIPDPNKYFLLKIWNWI